MAKKRSKKRNGLDWPGPWTVYRKIRRKVRKRPNARSLERKGKVVRPHKFLTSDAPLLALLSPHQPDFSRGFLTAHAWRLPRGGGRHA
jgi:hypothetical protein